MPGILSDAELADMRADVQAVACDKTCILQRKTTAVGPMGEPIGTWATIATTVAGMSQPSAGLLANYDYLIGSLAAWHVRLPWGTNARPQDHLTIDGQTLEVQVLLTPQSYASLDTMLATEVK